MADLFKEYDSSSSSSDDENHKKKEDDNYEMDFIPKSKQKHILSLLLIFLHIFEKIIAGLTLKVYFPYHL